MNGTTIPLSQLASVIRSKNAGPFLLTFDIMFRNLDDFNKAWNSGDFNRETLAHQFEVPAEQVLSIFAVPRGHAIKLTLRRPQPQGRIGESDMYGCQQHAPLLSFPVHI